MLKVPAKWTDDCQGKKDYDGDIVSISTRYWPEGGGFSVLHPDRTWTNGLPGIKPSAKSELILRHAGEGLNNRTVLAAKEFEADTRKRYLPR
jgi:hypothetical protein